MQAGRDKPALKVHTSTKSILPSCRDDASELSTLKQELSTLERAHHELSRSLRTTLYELRDSKAEAQAHAEGATMLATALEKERETAALVKADACVLKSRLDEALEGVRCGEDVHRVQKALESAQAEVSRLSTLLERSTAESAMLRQRLEAAETRSDDCIRVCPPCCSF